MVVVLVVYIARKNVVVITIMIYIFTCSTSRGTEEGDRKIKTSISPSEPQEDGKC